MSNDLKRLLPDSIPPSPEKRAKSTTLEPFPPSNVDAKVLAYSLKGSKMFKQKEKKVFEYMTNPPATVSIKDIGYGSMAIVYVNKYASKEEAYDWPILRAIQNYGTSNNSADKAFIHSFEWIGALPHRVSKTDTSPIWTYSDKNDGKYKQKVFLIKKKQDDSNEDVVKRFAKFLQNNNAPTEPKVPYDETDINHQAMDHYVTDESIVRFLHEMWHKPVNTTFFANNKRIHNEVFFSNPYPDIAKQVLGYPSVNKEDEGEDEGEDFDEFGHSPEPSQLDNILQRQLTQPDN